MDSAIADPSEPFLQLMNLLYCGQFNKEYKTLLGWQVTSFLGKRRQAHKGCSFVCKRMTETMHAKNGR